VWFLSLHPAILAGRLLGDRVLALPLVQLAFLASVVRDPNRLDPERRVETLRATLNCPAYLPMILAARRDVPARGLTEVRAPVLLAWCERDRILAREDRRARYDEELPPGIARALLRGVGHVPSLAQPERVATMIRDFVDRHRVTGRATA
jgi:pimeloyl-ACP methyl ester carboxylesterase